MNGAAEISNRDPWLGGWSAVEGEARRKRGVVGRSILLVAVVVVMMRERRDDRDVTGSARYSKGNECYKKDCGLRYGETLFSHSPGTTNGISD